MSDASDVPKPRINCSMLSQHISRPVCFVGRVEKVVSTSFNVFIVANLRNYPMVVNDEASLLILPGSSNGENIHNVGWRRKGLNS